MIMKAKVLPGLIGSLFLGSVLAPPLVLSQDLAAMTTIPPEKIQVVAALYPSCFTTPDQIAAQRKIQQAQAVKLLLVSFQQVTPVQSLVKALMPVKPTLLQSAANLQVMLKARNVSWEDYQQVLQAISTDGKAMDIFIAALDKERIEKTVINRAVQDPGYISQLADVQHRLIVSQLVQRLHPGGLPVAEGTANKLPEPLKGASDQQRQ